jgi:hypothetical protein
MEDRSGSKKRIIGNEEGFVLVLALSALVTLTLLGIWAMNSSNIELLISGNHQRFEEGFQVADGATNAEGGELGFSRQTWYEIPDPNDKGLPLVPTSVASYDPGGDIDTSKLPDPGKSAPDNFDEAADSLRKSDPLFWPMQNLLRANANTMNEYDYAYLTTFLYDTVAPKGSGEDFAGYRFRINGNRNISVEMGGVKLGPKVVSFED